MKYDYVCEECQMALFDTEEVLYSRCWKNKCFEKNAIQVPRQYLNDPVKLAEFKKLALLKK
jgi:hypothetical protein